jgi:hypothetical protein
MLVLHASDLAPKAVIFGQQLGIVYFDIIERLLAVFQLLCQAGPRPRFM